MAAKKTNIAENIKNAKEKASETTGKFSSAAASALITATEKINETSEKLSNVKDSAVKIASEVASKEIVEKGINVVKETTETLQKTAEKILPKKENRIEPKLFIQYYGNNISQSEIMDKFYKEWVKENNLDDIKSLEVYYKVEENSAYCVVNQDTTVKIKLL